MTEGVECGNWDGLEEVVAWNVRGAVPPAHLTRTPFTFFRMVKGSNRRRGFGGSNMNRNRQTVCVLCGTLWRRLGTVQVLRCEGGPPCPSLRPLLRLLTQTPIIRLVGRTRCAELGGGWSTQSSEIFGLLSSLLKYLSQGKTLRPALAEKSKKHRDMCLPSGWSGLNVSHCSSLI